MITTTRYIILNVSIRRNKPFYPYTIQVYVFFNKKITLSTMKNREYDRSDAWLLVNPCVLYQMYTYHLGGFHGSGFLEGNKSTQSVVYYFFF
jgi:hypothetical protein